jgi:hypothetical protein
MTPESIRVLSSLRNEFYTQFAVLMNVPVKISGSSHNSISFVASWLDEQEQFNYLSIYAYTAPDELSIERPFILRVAINKGASNVGFSRQGLASRTGNQRWQSELTVLPDQLLDFLPWIVNLVKAKAQGSSSFTQEPPHPLTVESSNWLLVSSIWSTRAEATLELQSSQVSSEFFSPDLSEPLNAPKSSVNFRQIFHSA